MTSSDLATFVTGYFVRHLAAERNVSAHTTAAYRDTLKLLLRFARDRAHRSVATLRFEDLTPALILQFLEHLETARHNTIRTRNARLAAIHSFVRYVADCEPALAVTCQRVLAIPLKKTTRPVLGYLTEAELAHLLAQVDRSTWDGERDYLLLALLYDTGARIQELLHLTATDFRLATPPFVRIQGKGRRERLCPLLPQTARLVSQFLTHPGRGTDPQTPHTRDEVYVVARGEGLFFNGAERRQVQPGSFIFVAAGQEHRFESFSPDFVVWVFFYGPAGGESAG